MMNGDLSGMVKKSMTDPAAAAPVAGDPGQEALLARVLASVKGVPAGQPQQGSNPYEAGLRADPANMGNRGRIEPDVQQAVQKLMMEELAKQQGGAQPLGQYPQQVKRPPGM
jgi:hypothetical protein